MRFGTTFSFIGENVDAVALKEKISYKSTDVPDRPVISVFNDSTEYQIVLDTLKKANANFSSRGFVRYSKEETENAPFYELKLNFPFQSQNKFWASDFGVEYEYSCEKCKKPSTIIRQLSPMKLDLRKVGKWQMFFVPPAIIVREDVKLAIEQENLTGVWFDKVSDYKGRDIEATHYQMHIEQTLPPMNAYTIKSTGGYLPCKVCGTTVTHLENPMSYSLNDFACAKDFNLSQEHIFNYDIQAVIISKRAREVIKKNVRRSNSIPILFVENIMHENL